MYQFPERMRGDEFSVENPNLYKGDVWSAGIIVQAMCTKKQEYLPIEKENNHLRNVRILDETKRFSRISTAVYSSDM